MSQPLEMFNPHRTPISSLRWTTIGREPLLTEIHAGLRRATGKAACPHWLITGPRGFGKTTLVRLAVDRLTSDTEIADKWQVVQLSEDEHLRVWSAATFLRSVVTRLYNAWTEQAGDAGVRTLISEALAQLESMLADDSMYTVARATMEKFCHATGRNLLVVAENLDTFFGKLRDNKETAQLRDFFQHGRTVSLLATSITTELGRNIERASHPFYRFFSMLPLSRLSPQELITQLLRLADLDSEDSGARVRRLLREKERRIAVVCHLTGGNPRLGVVLYSVLAGLGQTIEAITLLHGLLDHNTPYFLDRVRDLPDREQPIAACFCEAETTLTGADIAKRLGMNKNSVYSLIERLVGAGFLEPVSSPGGVKRKGKYYQVAEDFMRMWWQYRFGRVEQVQKVVHFLALLYEPGELTEMWHMLHSWRTQAPDPAAYRRLDLTEGYFSQAISCCGSFSFEELVGRLAPSLQVLAVIEKPTVHAETPVADSRRDDEIRKLRKLAAAGTATDQQLLALGKLLIQSGELLDAQTILGQAIVLAPSNVAAWKLLGRAKAFQNDLVGAQEALEKAVTLAPSDGEAWKWLGAVRNNQGNPAGAQEAFEKAVALAPSDGNAWKWLGAARHNQGKYASAQEALEKAVVLAPPDGDAWKWLGEARHNQANHAGAQEAYEKAVALVPSDADAWKWLGAARGEQGNYAAAQEAFEKAVALAPSDADAWKWLGAARGKQGNDAGTQEAFEKAVKLAPSDAATWIPLGAARLIQENHAGAQEAFEKAVALTPSDAQAWRWLGQARFNQANHAAAQEAFERTVALDPSYAEAWKWLGAARGNQGNHASAQEALEKAVALTPSDAQAWSWLGQARSNQANHAGAQEALEKAVTLAPLDAAAWKLIGASSVTQDDLARAQEALEKTVALTPSDAQAWMWLGRVRSKQANHAAAQEAFEKTVALDPSDAEAWQRLAAARGDQGNHSGAQEALEKALALAPSNTAAWGALGAVRFWQSNYSGAQEAFEKAVALASSNAAAWGALGAARFRQSNYSGAQEAFEKAVALDASDANLLTLLGKARGLQDKLPGALDAFQKAVALAPSDAEALAYEAAARAAVEKKCSATDLFQTVLTSLGHSPLTYAYVFNAARDMSLDIAKAAEQLVDNVEFLREPTNPTEWDTLVRAAASGLLSRLNLKDVASLRDRREVLKKMAKAHPRLAALDLLHFVFDHFIALLAPDEVPSGRKLSARSRGEYVFQLAPRELRQPIRMIAEAVSKGNDHEVEGIIPDLSGLLSTLSPLWNDTGKFLRDEHGYERQKGYENIERAIAEAIPLPYEIGRLLVTASANQNMPSDERARVVNLLQRLKAFEFWHELLNLWLAQTPDLPREVGNSLCNFFREPDNTVGFERLVGRLARLDLRKLERPISEGVLLCLRARLKSGSRLLRDMQARILEVVEQYTNDPGLGALATEIEKIIR